MTEFTEQQVKIKVAARLLGVTAQTIRNWVSAGRLPAKRHPINGYRLFNLADIERIRTMHSHVSEPLISGRPTYYRKNELGIKEYVAEGRPTTSNSVVAKSISGSSADNLYGSAEFDKDWLKQPVRNAETATTSERLRIADVFSGGGVFSVGIQEGLRSAGLCATHAIGIDFNKDAIDTFALNFPDAMAIHGDILSYADGAFGSRTSKAEREFCAMSGRIDVLAGGPPCQGHSDLNNHTRRVDPKNELYFSMVRLCELFRPRIVLIENVPGVLHDKGDVVARTSDCLRSLGYHVSYSVVDLQKIGVPQRRKRLVLVASVNGAFDFDEALRNHEVVPRSIGWAIDDLVNSYNPKSIFDSSAKHSEENQRRIRFLFDNDLYELPNSERPPCHRDREHSYTSVYGRMKWNEPAPTITGGFGSTGQGRFVHPKAQRTLTPHEAGRLQFIPDFFHFPKSVGRRSMQQIIGNAAPPKLSEVIITEAANQGLLK